MKRIHLISWYAGLALAAAQFPVHAQSVLFDFENATLHSPLPITLTVSGVTAQFSATGQGFSIQLANTMGFTPVGFSGNCVYPSSIGPADLLISFSTAVTDFSILYAPDELACDSSATMRVTAYQNGAFVGTTITNAQPGTWPTETLRFSSAQAFNSVVVHYDQPPATGGDYGTIFMADNVAVTPAPLPIILTNAVVLADGTFQFSFNNTPGAPCTVFGTTNLSLPFSNWVSVPGVIEVSPGNFQFTDAGAATRPQCFYRVSSP